MKGENFTKVVNNGKYFQRTVITVHKQVIQHGQSTTQRQE
jgi:hypothetical protein